MLDLGSAVGYLLLDTKDFQSNLDKANAGLKTFGDKNAKTADKIKGLSSAFGQIGGDMTTFVTLPLIGAGTAFVNFASEMDSAFDAYKAQIGEVTGDMEEYKDVMDEIYKNNYGESYEDIANAMATITKQLGQMKPDKMQKVTESAIALRDTMGYDVPESIRTVDTLMKNFGLTAEEAFDYIVKGNQEGLDFSDEFLDTINEYSVQFKKLGFDANDMFNILRTGADSGAWNLDKVGDAIKEFSIRVIDGSDTTKHALETLGYDFEETMETFAKGGDGARDVFFELITQLSYMDDEVEKSTVGVELFGTMWEDLGPEVIKQLSDMQVSVIDTKGAMDTLKEVKYDNLESAIGGLLRSLQSAGAELGEILIPKIEDAVEAIDAMTDRFENMPDETKEMIVNFGLIAAAIGPVLLLLSKILGPIASLVSYITSAGGVTAALSQMGSSLAALAGPVGLVIALVGTLVAAWTTNFGGMRDATASIFESIQIIIGSALDIIRGLWESNFLGLQDIITVWWENLELYWGMIFETMAGIFEVFALLFQGNWEGAWNKVQEIFINIWETVKTLFMNYLNFLVDSLIKIGVRLYHGAKDALVNIYNAALEWIEEFMLWWEGVLEDPVQAVKDIGQDMWDAGVEIFNMLWDGAKSIWDSIVDWVNECVDWIVSKVKFWESESAKVSNSEPSGAGRRTSGSHSAGLDYVPYDGYVAETHEGEAILTKEEADDYRNNRNGNGDMFIFNSPKPISEIEAARQVRRVKKEIAEDLL